MEYKTGIIGRLFMAIIIGVAMGVPLRVSAQTGAAPGVVSLSVGLGAKAEILAGRGTAVAGI